MTIDPFETPPDIKLVILTGPSGSGKTTIAQELMRRFPEISLVISCTTRDKRESDLPGEYAYFSKDEFRGYVQSGSFHWSVSAHGNSYGTLTSSLQDAIESRWPKLMLLVPSSLELLMSFARGKVQPFFILPPPEDILRERLTERGDNPKDIAKRLEDCRTWLDEARSSWIPYEFIDNSGDVDSAVAQLENKLRELSSLPA